MKRRLSQIVSDLDCSLVSGDLSIPITGVTYNSKLVEEGNLFVCIKGFKSDGHDYAGDALRKGAKAFLVEREIDLPGTVLKVKNTRRALAVVSKGFYGAVEITLIGITGTNGKTTTSYLAKSILDKGGIESGLIGTIEYLVGNERMEAFRTTPESSDLWKVLHRMESMGITHVLMEVTSHGLALDRVHGLDFELAVFTNLSQDHIDFHRSVENYREAKLKLFRGLKGGAISIVNVDDPVGDEIRKISGVRTLTYAMEKDADITGSFRSLGWEGSELTVSSDGEEVTLATSLIGRPNMYNVLAAFAVGSALTLPQETIVRGVEELKSIPGRFEVVATKPHIVVDYAHTPQALQELLTSVRKLTGGKLISVFGCGGERDREKRPKMGRISATLADSTIITSDNPRSEPPQSIISDIRKGLGSLSGKTRTCEDRRQAIFQAIREASPDDTVVVAGRGHERFQIFRDQVVDFDDREVAREIHATLYG